MTRASCTLLTLFVVTALGGCGADATPTASPTPTLAPAGAGPAVNGSGHFEHPGGWYRTFSLHAVVDRQGAVVGSFNLVNHVRPVNRESHTTARVTCFQVDGNVARMGGIVTADTEIGPGDPVIWTVVDNGEGGNAPPDQISRAYILGDPADVEAYCDGTWAVALPLSDVANGNVQVRP